VDDTGVGIDEGREAGCWTVGVSLSGNEAGVTPGELGSMSDPEKDALRRKASAALGKHRPDYIIDTVADLLPILDEIERRLDKGERPGG
jgi:phosphonoacetaldehyde hydrolase